VDPNLITTTQAAVDPVFMFIFGACLALLVGITAVMVWFTIRYHRSRSPEPTSKNDGNLWLEIIWTVFPTILVMAMFYYGWAGYLALRNVPKGSMEVTATARMWSWTFTYPNGKTSAKLYVPAGKPVKVDLVALDVLHGFYLPAFRVKRDVVPGMKNHAWFVATKPGSYDLFCSQYCGTGHSAMITTVEALPETEFAAWLNRVEQGTEHPGKELLEKHSCLGCHSLDGSPKVGPTFKGIWGRHETVLTGGVEHEIVEDENYLRRSILDPKADIVKGFPPVMPVLPLKEEEIREIISFLKGGISSASKPNGAKLAKEKGCLGCHSLDGSKMVGPTFKGLYRSTIKVVRDGKPVTVTVDDAYLIESIRKPKADIVEGFPPIMPDYPDLSDTDMQALVEFIEGVR
jgi:cytochrome c oxidase subunit 2